MEGRAGHAGYNRLWLALPLAVYLLLPTRNYYWDGVAFAINVEKQLPLRDTLHPNHLIYTAAYVWLYHAALLIGLKTRALFLMQFVNSLLAGASVALVYRALRRRTIRTDGAIAGALAFAFAATWWKFSTDADAYIPSIFLIVVRERPARNQAQRGFGGGDARGGDAVSRTGVSLSADSPVAVERTEEGRVLCGMLAGADRHRIRFGLPDGVRTVPRRWPGRLGDGAFAGCLVLVAAGARLRPDARGHAASLLRRQTRRGEAANRSPSSGLQPWLPARWDWRWAGGAAARFGFAFHQRTCCCGLPYMRHFCSCGCRRTRSTVCSTWRRWCSPCAARWGAPRADRLLPWTICGVLFLWNLTFAIYPQSRVENNAAAAFCAGAARELAAGHADCVSHFPSGPVDHQLLQPAGRVDRVRQNGSRPVGPEPDRCAATGPAAVAGSDGIRIPVSRSRRPALAGIAPGSRVVALSRPEARVPLLSSAVG